MALLFLESFDYSAGFPTQSSLNTQQMLRRRYSAVDLTSFEDGAADPGAHGGNALRYGHGNQFMRTLSLRDQLDDEIGVFGARMKIQHGEFVGNNASWLAVMTRDRNTLAWRLNQNGSISAYRDNNTFLETGPPGLINVNMGWFYLELKWRISDTVGNWEFRIDEQVVWTSGNYDTKVWNNDPWYWDGFQWWGAGIVEDTLYDDIYILDGSGSVNNDYLGDTVVEQINPSADGDSSTWTPSAGTDHSALVDDAQNISTDGVDETDYIEGDATGEKDLFQYEDLTHLTNSPTIHGVQVTTYRRVTEATPKNMLIVAKQNGTEGTVTQTVRHDDSVRMHTGLTIFEQNPDTAAAWTPGQIDDAQFGVEVP